MKNNAQHAILVTCILLGILCGMLSGCTLFAPSETTVQTQPATTLPPTEPPTEPPTDPPTEPSTEPLAIPHESTDLLKLIYSEEPEYTPTDYLLLDVIYVDDVTYKVVWTTDAPEELVKLVPNGDGSITVDVTENCPEEIPYTLTATIATAEGYWVTHTWHRILPGLSDMVSIVKTAYELKRGQKMDHPVTLTGKITSIDKAWSEDYETITVTIVVEGCENLPIRCYSLQGDGLENLCKGDVITVIGTLQNYSSRIEFDTGCKLIPENTETGKEETNYEE